MNANLFLTAQVGFGLLTAIFLYLLLKALKQGIEKTPWQAQKKSKTFTFILGTITVWLIFVSVWSATGMMGNFENFPFNFAPIIIIPLVSIVLLVIFSSGLREILSHVPPTKMIVLQNFRMFVEVLLWLLFVATMLPKQMTFEGRNFDVLSGLTAPIIAWLFHQNKISKTVVIVWNFLCLGLLINIVTIAILSTPSPWQTFFEEPSNTVVTLFPISFLPGFLVPLAYTLHFFSLKQLLSSRAVAATHS
jgi:hypothetical protein